MLYTKLVLRVPRLILYFVQLFSFVPIQGLFYDTPSDKFVIYKLPYVNFANVILALQFYDKDKKN